MTRWFRMYDEMLDDPKVQMLSPELFKTWVNLLAVASRHGGVLPPVEKLAFALRVSVHEMQSRVEELVLCELIDIRPDRKHEPHNWSQRQWKSDDSAERVRKHRASKRACNADVTVTVTPPEPDTETDTDKLLLSEQVAARSDEHVFKFGLKKVSGKDEGQNLEPLCKRAEGLGLDVAELIETTNRNRPRKRSAYFTTLCVNRLKGRLPGLDEQIIRDAIWGNSESAYGQLCELLICAEAVP